MQSKLSILVAALALQTVAIGMLKADDPNAPPIPPASSQPGAAGSQPSAAAAASPPATSPASPAAATSSAETHALCPAAEGEECCPMTGCWFADVEASLLSLHARTGGRMTLSISDSTAPGVSAESFNQLGGVNDYGVASRFVVGRQINEKWAVFGRYWNLTDNSSPYPTVSPGFTPSGNNFGTYSSFNTCELYTIDFEIVRRFKVWGWDIDAGAGARHASLDVSSAITAFGVFTTGNFINLTYANGCSFEGSGVLGEITAKRPFGEGPWSMLLGVRGSANYGLSDSFGRAVGSVASSPSAPLVGAATVRRNGAAAEMDIYEVEVGLQYERKLACLPATAFFRTSFEFQQWNLIGKPTGGAGFGGTIGEITTNGFASAGLGNTDMAGVTFAAGFNW
jgi:hypothetical protein